MNKSLSEYKTIVFDCDGVVLDSNRVKTEAFYEATKHYGDELAQALVDYHIAHGGVSRYQKFEYFFKEIVGGAYNDNDMEALLKKFGLAVHTGLIECAIAPGLKALREKTYNANWLIVSGGDQDELREVFRLRDLADLFDGGIFGSPEDKSRILAREIETQNIRFDALFLGDSKYDYCSASNAGLDFLFLSDWSEVEDWKVWTNENNISSCKSIQDLVFR